MDHNSYLITKTVNRGGDDETIFVFTDDAPQWFKDTVMDLHDGMLPDDWTFQAVSDVWDSIMERHDTDDARDYSADIADENLEHRTWHLLEWAKSHTADIDDAYEDLGDAMRHGGITHVIAIGQHYVLDRMVHILCDAIDEHDDD